MDEYVVTVTLPGRYWDARMLVSASSREQAKEFAQQNLDALAEYVPQAKLQAIWVSPLNHEDPNAK
jgi:hypothetical protein